MKKQWKRWNEKKEQSEQAKNEYDNFYNNDDLIAIKDILLSFHNKKDENEEISSFLIEKDILSFSIKDILKKYYNKTDRFNKVIEILQKIIFDIKMRETLLTCPKCSTNLEIITFKNKTKLIEHKSKIIDHSYKEIAENGISAIQKLDSLLSEYQMYKDIGDEPEKGIEPFFENSKNEKFSENDKNDLKKKLRKYENLVFPDFKKFSDFSVEEYEKFIEENSNYILYKKGLENLKKYKYDIPIENLDAKQSQKLLTELTSIISQLKSIKTELNSFDELKEPQFDITEMEESISENDTEIDKIKNLIDVGNDLLKLDKIENDLNIQKKSLEELTERHINLDKIKQIIAETGSHAMEETVETINSILQDISLAIYNNDTVISMSMFKEFKTKDYLKPQPTITVTQGYGDDEEKYDFEEELCGGEQSRVSLALTLAFATVSTTPFLFIDEGLSSMDSILIDRCMKIVKKYAHNKTIINVCHGITQGIHDNIIEIEDERI
jgi:energy-coupling factor transporter ATP-binding protein EcfA2